MFELMKNGATIQIKSYAKGTEDYAPAKFWIDNGVLWSSSPFVGTFPRDDLTEQKFNEHIANMILEGFQIIANK